MKKQDFSGKEERQIITGMIVNNQVLSRIASKYDDEMFASPWANLVGKWCVDYHRKYKTAPGKNIEPIFRKWADKQDDNASTEIVEKFLRGLSKQYKESELNADFVVDVAGEYFNRHRLKTALQIASEQLENGQYDKADETISKVTRIDLGESSFSNPYQETDVHKRAYEKQTEVLVEYEGPAGKFFGRRLCRDALVIFQAPEKGKKSFWLQDILHRGLRNRRKILYIQVGDMSEDQITFRMQERLCLRPHLWNTKNGDGRWTYPTSMTRRKGGREPKIVREKRRVKDELTLGMVKLAQKRFNDTFLHTKKTQFLKMHCTAEITMAEIRSMIERFIEVEDWIPDIVILDYIDLVDSPRYIKEPRDQINHNFREARKISQKFHVLFVSATQANAQAYKKMSQDRGSFSNDKRKMAHPTALIAINQPSDYMEENEIVSLNYVVVRGPKPRSLWCAMALGAANPCVISC